MSELVKELESFSGELSQEEETAIFVFIDKNADHLELRYKAKEKKPEMELGVPAKDGMVYNPISGHVLEGDKFAPLYELEGAKQHATRKQWESVGREVVGAPSLVTQVYKNMAIYYSYESTEDARHNTKS